MEPELIEVLIIQLLGSAFFSRFEGETPALRKMLKWVIFDGITIGLYFAIGHWALLFPVLGLIPGVIIHVSWCRKNGIDPLKATPRKKYYELRGWKYEE